MSNVNSRKMYSTYYNKLTCVSVHATAGASFSCRVTVVELLRAVTNYMYLNQRMDILECIQSDVNFATVSIKLQQTKIMF